MSERRETDAERGASTIHVTVDARVSPNTEFRYCFSISTVQAAPMMEGPTRVHVVPAGTSSIAPGLRVEERA